VRNPTWSPSGSAVAFEDGDGIWIQQVPDLASTTCAALTERLLLPGAKHADWGPADVDPSQKPGAAGGPPAAPGVVTPRPPTGSGVGRRSPLRSVAVARHAARGQGLRVRLSLRRPARVRIVVCRYVRARCVGTVARTVVKARAGSTTATVTLRRLPVGRYTVRITPAGGPTITRPLRVR
jgi:hypothetical protein